MTFMRRMLPLRIELDDGTTHFVRVADMEHATLARAAKVDQCCRFDVPRTFFDDGATPTNDKRINGYIIRDGKPIGTIHRCFESERLYDHDPTSLADRHRL